jgi:hypothetical protein
MQKFEKCVKATISIYLSPGAFPFVLRDVVWQHIIYSCWTTTQFPNERRYRSEREFRRAAPERGRNYRVFAAAALKAAAIVKSMRG